jgi:hypothetical protein
MMNSLSGLYLDERERPDRGRKNEVKDCEFAHRSELPHNGSRISGEPLLMRFDESAQGGASWHEPPFPEPKGRRV